MEQVDEHRHVARVRPPPGRAGQHGEEARLLATATRVREGLSPPPDLADTKPRHQRGGDMGRYGEMWGYMGRYGEIRAISGAEAA